MQKISELERISQDICKIKKKLKKERVFIFSHSHFSISLYNTPFSILKHFNYTENKFYIFKSVSTNKCDCLFRRGIFFFLFIIF